MLWKEKHKNRPDPRFARGQELDVVHEYLKPVREYCPACGQKWAVDPHRLELHRKLHAETCPRLHREIIVLRGNDPFVDKAIREGKL
jgi:hypothetical protein